MPKTPVVVLVIIDYHLLKDEVNKRMDGQYDRDYIYNVANGFAFSKKVKCCIDDIMREQPTSLKVPAWRSNT